MRIVFAGTPDFAVPSLKALVAAGHDVAAALTQPDRAAGRGRRVVTGPVTDCARGLNIQVLQPETLKDEEALEALRKLHPELMVVAAYGLILNRRVLDLPQRGCVNVHASLLPRWRGAAPIHRAIEAGDKETGVCIMQMAPGLDTGPVLARRSTPIAATDTTGSLHDRLSVLGAELLVETLKGMEAGTVRAEPQDDSLATYAAKITPDDARADWRQPAERLERLVRAMNPWPVVRVTHGGRTLRVWQARVVSGDAGEPGEIVRVNRDGVDVACGRDVLRLTVLQRQGGKPLPAGEFINGYPLQAGERFDS
jgi:methionyl-tRNA formyltransferase